MSQTNKTPNVQVLYTQPFVTGYMENLHPDDRQEGCVVRLWNFPDKSHSQPMVAVPIGGVDLSMELHLRELVQVGTILDDIIVAMDLSKLHGSTMNLQQGNGVVRVRDKMHAVAIAARLLSWASIGHPDEN